MFSNNINTFAKMGKVTFPLIFYKKYYITIIGQVLYIKCIDFLCINERSDKIEFTGSMSRVT